ncbi:TetR/AcrR family transcriptional regulator [Caballeronia sp. GAFFF1]|uniref:TetR/AcrR family transcriptional regulator n=1 Tax=Caballeronia sp. GAFFF1 TaxID=2921779 RepID=UPI0020286E9F|nr:TetR/AcrR family transcriptional regulator [Caballeronia sp. GAFFF1]
MTTSATNMTTEARPRTPQRRAESEVTRQRILDCAEQLFADKGFHATSIRDIANLVECQFALIGYHFGTKTELLDHVLARRASVLNNDRMERLEDLRASSGGRPIALRQLIESFVATIMDRAAHEEEGWRNYTRLIAAVSTNAEWSELTDKHFNTVAREYVGEIQRSLPELSSNSLHQAFFFLLGAMVTVCARPDRIETLSMGRFDSRRIGSLTDNLCQFLEGGFMAVARRDAASTAPKSDSRKRGTKRT